MIVCCVLFSVFFSLSLDNPGGVFLKGRIAYQYFTFKNQPKQKNVGEKITLFVQVPSTIVNR